VNNERLMNVILAPHVSEKATSRADTQNQHVFSVAKNANKLEVKKAVEKMFEVEVAEVKLLNIHGKLKRLGRRFGKRKDWKKAYVKLKEGFDINFGEKETKT
tara:strand:+ start:187 stop:492 length:306 start_codon:yes stop_codon:yes gene_type:complete